MKETDHNSAAPSGISLLLPQRAMSKSLLVWPSLDLGQDLLRFVASSKVQFL